MQKIFVFYSDPGHGWLKVSKALLDGLGILGQVSHYSYMRKGFVYLEEDQDASLFINAYRAKYGVDPKFKEANARTKRSKIRSYDNFNPMEA